MKLRSELFGGVCTDKRCVNPQILEQVILLSVEIAREGREGRKIGRNEPCPCGSGKKYKKCCGK